MKKIWTFVPWKNVTCKNDTNFSETFKNFLIKANELHNSEWKSCNIQTVARFLEYNLENENLDLYDRYLQILKIKKDSSSLKSCILRYGKELGKQKYEEKCEKSASLKLQKYIQKYGNIQGPIEYQKHRIKVSHSLEGYILRNGKELGKQKYINYWKNTNFSTSKDAYIRRHGVKLGTEKYLEFIEFCRQHSSGKLVSTEKFKQTQLKKSKTLKLLKYNRDTVSLKSYISRHGEIEGLKKYKENLLKNKNFNKICIEYWINKGYTLVDAKLQVSKEQCSRMVNWGRASKQSTKCLVPVYKYIRKNFNLTKDDIYWGVGKSKEYFMDHASGRYFYDFCIPKLKLIIEFHGILFHSKENNKLYPGLDKKIIEERDFNKENVAISKGFKYLIIWSDESYKKNIEKCISYIKEHYETHQLRKNYSNNKTDIS